MRYLASILLALTLIAFAQPVSATSAAQRIRDALYGTAEEAGYETFSENAGDTIPEVVGNIINLVMSALGTIAVLLILYAGYLWMTAGGNDDQISKSKSILKQVTVGLIVLALGYAIVSFVVTQISGAAGGDEPPSATESAN